MSVDPSFERRPDPAAPARAADEVGGEERELLVCRCEEITLGEILDAVDDGITTMDGLKRRLRIGMGLCQGRTCRRLLQRELARRAGVAPGEVRPGTFRPPVRPVRFAVLADEREAPAAGPPVAAASADADDSELSGTL